MRKALSRACVVAIAWLAPVAVMAATTKPTVKIVGEVTITFGADGSMSVKTGEGAVTTFGEAAEATPAAAKPGAVKPTAARKAPAGAAKDAPIATALPSSTILKTSTLALAAGGGGGDQAPPAAAVGAGGSDGEAPETEKTTVETKTTTTTDGGAPSTTEVVETKTTTTDKKSVVADLYAGTGALVSGNLGGRRADAIKFITRQDGEVLAQVQKSEDVDIQIAVETHYLLQHQSLFTGASANKGAGWERLWDGVGKLVACGPFALANDTSGQVVGCGPLFTAVLDSDAKIDQFGVGWALGLGKKAGSPERADFGVGIGVLFDTDSKVVDHRIIDKDSMLVLPEFRDAIKADSASAISPLITRPSASAFIMVSKTF